LTLAKRLKAMGSAKYQTDGDPRTSGPGFGVALHDGDLSLPLRWREPRVVFVNSMSDLFHARVPLEFVSQVFSVIADTPQHTYQILTKRSTRLKKVAERLEWPPNLWMGVSVEESSALFRVDDLRTVPAAVRFLSCEPLIGPLEATSEPPQSGLRITAGRRAIIESSSRRWLHNSPRLRPGRTVGPGWLCIVATGVNVRFRRGQVERQRFTARDGAQAGDHSASANPASRGGRLTGRPSRRAT
jgi:hypothetical protein